MFSRGTEEVPAIHANLDYAGRTHTTGSHDLARSRARKCHNMTTLQPYVEPVMENVLCIETSIKKFQYIVLGP
jgi:hypothetical protein